MPRPRSEGLFVMGSVRVLLGSYRGFCKGSYKGFYKGSCKG